jgi:hypothetical protein
MARLWQIRAGITSIIVLKRERSCRLRTIEVRMYSVAITPPFKPTSFLKILLAVSRRRVISIVGICRGTVSDVIITTIVIVSMMHFFLQNNTVKYKEN